MRPNKRGPWPRGGMTSSRADTEDAHQRALADYLDLIGVLWCHVPNGGARNAAEGGKLKAQGVKTGVPDVLIFDVPPGCPRVHGIAIELKRPKGAHGGRAGKPTDAQLRWLEDLSNHHWLTRVCCGSAEAIDWLCSLGLRSES